MDMHDELQLNADIGETHPGDGSFENIRTQCTL